MSNIKIIITINEGDGFSIETGLTDENLFPFLLGVVEAISINVAPEHTPQLKAIADQAIIKASNNMKGGAKK